MWVDQDTSISASDIGRRVTGTNGTYALILASSIVDDVYKLIEGCWLSLRNWCASLLAKPVRPLIRIRHLGEGSAGVG